MAEDRSFLIEFSEPHSDVVRVVSMPYSSDMDEIDTEIWLLDHFKFIYKKDYESNRPKVISTFETDSAIPEDNMAVYFFDKLKQFCEKNYIHIGKLHRDSAILTVGDNEYYIKLLEINHDNLYGYIHGYSFLIISGNKQKIISRRFDIDKPFKGFDFDEMMDYFIDNVPMTIPKFDDGGLIGETIIVDGIERPTRNSNGEFIHGTVEGIKNFWRWFGESKVVDEQGRPLVVYHRTDSKFTTFDKELLGAKSQWETAYFGFYFSNKNDIGHYGDKVMRCYLKITNPYLIETETYADFDYDYKRFDPDNFNENDGVFVFAERLALDEKADKHFIVFEPNQVKSATGNNGDFSTENNDIRFADGGMLDDSNQIEIEEKSDIDKVEQLVRDRIIKAQEKRQFKDTSVLTFTKKYKSAYDALVTLENLDEYQKDNVRAYKAINKDNVWPEYNITVEREAGNSSSVTYMKIKARSFLTNRPPDDKISRDTYVIAVSAIVELFDQCKTYDEFLQTIAKIHEVVGQIALGVDGYKQWYDENVKAHIKDHWKQSVGATITEYVLGDKFKSLGYGKYSASKAIDNMLEKAKMIEPFTKEQQDRIVESLSDSYKTKISKQKKLLEAFEKAETASELIRYQQEIGYGYNNDYIKKIFKQNLKPIAISAIKAKIASSENEYNAVLDRSGLPEKYQVREESWDWVNADTNNDGKKDRKKREYPSLNEKKPLSHIKRTGGLKIDVVDVNSLVEKFGFNNFGTGNYVKDNETGEHLRHFLGAMADLSELLNIDIYTVNQIGKLSITIGATGSGGRAMATYNASHKNINLTKRRGDGCIAHEWGHYFDNIIAEKSQKRGESWFASSLNIVQQSDDNWHVVQLISELISYIRNGSGGYVKMKKKFRASDAKYSYRVDTNLTIDEVIAESKRKYPIYRYYQYANRKSVVQYFSFLAKHFGHDEIEVEFDYKSTQFYTSSNEVGGEYWIKSIELFARAFEAYIQRKLDKAGRSNNYLVSYIDMWSEYDFMPYPVDEELDQIEILFDKIIKAFKQQFNVPDFKPFTDERQDEYIDLSDASPKEIVDTKVVVESDSKKSESMIKITKSKLALMQIEIDTMELEMSFESDDDNTKTVSVESTVVGDESTKPDFISFVNNPPKVLYDGSGNEWRYIPESSKYSFGKTLVYLRSAHTSIMGDEFYTKKPE